MKKKLLEGALHLLRYLAKVVRGGEKMARGHHQSAKRHQTPSNIHIYVLNHVPTKKGRNDVPESQRWRTMASPSQTAAPETPVTY